MGAQGSEAARQKRCDENRQPIQGITTLFNRSVGSPSCRGCAAARVRGASFLQSRICTGRQVGDSREPCSALCKRACPGVTLVHAMPRGAARNLIRSGISETVAMAITGHKTRSVSARYDITSQDDVRRPLSACRRTWPSSLRRIVWMWMARRSLRSGASQRSDGRLRNYAYYHRTCTISDRSGDLLRFPTEKSLICRSFPTVSR